MDQIKIHGKNWDAIKKAIPTKSVAQVKNYWINYYKKLNLTAYLPVKSSNFNAPDSAILINDSSIEEASDINHKATTSDEIDPGLLQVQSQSSSSMVAF